MRSWLVMKLFMIILLTKKNKRKEKKINKRKLKKKTTKNKQKQKQKQKKKTKQKIPNFQDPDSVNFCDERKNFRGLAVTQSLVITPTHLVRTRNGMK